MSRRKRMSISAPARTVTGLIAALAASACGDAPPPYKPSGELPAWESAHPHRPAPGTSFPAYRGSNAIVLEAEARFPTGLALHQNVIQRTCSPNDGVCHNTKEYPDLHTAANFMAAFEAPCNVQAGTPEGIFDLCERPGDRFSLDTTAVASGPREIGRVAFIPGEKPSYSKDNLPGADSPNLHLFLAEPIVTERVEIWSGGRFIRTFIDDTGIVKDLAFATLSTRWWVLDGGKHLVGEVANYQRDEITRLLDVGIIEGDANGNGIYGARNADPITLLAPGDPEGSYLIGRVRGSLAGVAVPGTRMPLANQPLSVSEMLALYCFIEGFDPAKTSIQSGIDYANCSYSANPESLDLLGVPSEETTVTWQNRIGPLLDVNCGGCHDAATPSAGLPMTGEGVYAHLLGRSEGRPDMPFITPGDPTASYLWLKLTNGEGIDGSPMPTSPISGWRPMRQGDLDLIEAWILAGAPEVEESP